MKNFKDVVLREIKNYKDQDKQGIEKFFLSENKYDSYIKFNEVKKDVFDVKITSLSLDIIKEIYGLFSFDLQSVREVVDLYMRHMDDTQLTTPVNNIPTFDIENFRADSYYYEMVIPLKDRNVIANRETLYTVLKGYNIYPSVRVVMKFIIKGDDLQPVVDIELPLARKERFLVSVDRSYDITTIDKKIQKAIRQRVVCLLTTKRIKTFTRKEIIDADFSDIGRYMTLLAMDAI